MKVVRRNGELELVQMDKITKRLRSLSKGLASIIDPTEVAIKTVAQLHDGITTAQLDIISADIANSMALIHLDYGVLAGRIRVSNLHKHTIGVFSEATKFAAQNTKAISRRHYHYIMTNAAALDALIDHEADFVFDFFGFATLEFSYLIHRKVGKAPTWTRETIDRPQYMWMRTAIAIHADTTRAGPAPEVEIAEIAETYKLLSGLKFTHATPTLYNSISQTQQLNSCFLLSTADSLEEINRTISNASKISKWAGGIGLAFHDIRAAGSIIRGTGGASSGLPKQLKIFNEAARTWDQGGKRKGAFAAYLEPWHADIMEFLRLKQNTGAAELRARDLFYAIWVPDLFVERVRDDEPWSLFSEDTAPGLSDVYDGMRVCQHCGFCANRNYLRAVSAGAIKAAAALGHVRPAVSAESLDDINAARADRVGGRHSRFRSINDGKDEEARFAKYLADNVTCSGRGSAKHNFAPTNVFTNLYVRYENEGRAMRTISARSVLDLINELRRETGTPYICFKDHANRRSNQENIGTLRSSNLCTEIMEWHSEYSYACCCLASINLRAYIATDSAGKKYFDHEELHRVVKVITRNLDKIIDCNEYPAEECIENAVGLRPIGIGVQGLADLLAILRLPFLSPEAAALDIEIAETIYHAALSASAEMAVTKGAYDGFADSPAARGILQFDMWAADIDNRQVNIWGDTGLDRRGKTTVEKIVSGRYDWDKLRAAIRRDGLRNSLLLAFMPTASTSQIMGNNESFEPFSGNISTKSTQFGKYVVTNKWLIRHLIELGLWNETTRDILMSGSVYDIPGIPDDVAKIYLTVWEMKQRELMRRAAIRGAFVDQAQSLNVFISDNSNSILAGIFSAGWEFGLKTGTYYTRSRPSVRAMGNNLSRSGGLASPVVRPKASDDFCTIGCDSCSS